MSIQFTILELVCSVCVNTVTTAIKFIDSITTFSAKPTTKLVSIAIQASETQIK
ncbi:MULTISPECIES: copper chaperone [Nostocaceae]|uniref:Copper chaperone n=1 Tax=Nostoc paludosum FACHB-159 TaxID=2692908 RepID=A0ABR8KFF1_9NOSO|nr:MULTISPECIES: copper chaperone [Nostocaceae]MBD2477777.1 copper chaperone [Anabaena sp. FACHB-83]MBD2738289.1 copper chaperone [Nostoc paludosum FACHB-159]